MNINDDYDDYKNYCKIINEKPMKKYEYYNIRTELMNKYDIIHVSHPIYNISADCVFST